MQASSILLHNSTKPPLNQVFHTIQSERAEWKKMLLHPQYLIAFHIANPLFMKLVVKKLYF